MKVENKQAYRLLYPRLTVLVSSGSGDERDVMTVAWSTPISFNPSLIGVSISPKRYSYGVIENTQKFAINIPTQEIAEETFFIGQKSGRDIDKFERTDLTPKSGETGVTIIEECYANIECELVDKPVYGDHTLFIGKVKNAEVKEDALKDNNFPDPKTGMLYWMSSGNEEGYLSFRNSQ
ncbi:hypothetical protein C9439_01015 [archaeon SCG-AAA382B04]|nr:hypothetical protein C9439_01015 [archaeon SCG-AAA382B04]